MGPQDTTRIFIVLQVKRFPGKGYQPFQVQDMRYSLAPLNFSCIIAVVLLSAFICHKSTNASPWADIDVCYERACERICNTDDGIYRCSCNPDVLLLYDGKSCRPRGKKRNRRMTPPMSRPVETIFHSPTFGPLVYFPDKQTSIKHDPDRALHRLPDGLVVKESLIPNAGLGVFTEKEIVFRTTIGPYRGVKYTDEDSSLESGYSFAIREPGKGLYYVDAEDRTLSNWLRYINSPTFKGEENLVSFKYKGGIYYRAKERILPGQELLVWYGDAYGTWLQNNMHPQTKTEL